MNNVPLVHFSSVTYSYSTETKNVLEDFDLQINNGTVTAILGPNGAGKTTLLHLALGWLKPARGLIKINNRPLGEYNRRDLGQFMGLVPQNEHIPFEFSLLDYVLLGRAPYLPPLAMPGDSDYEIAGNAIQLVGLQAMQNRSILSLSGGERQLVLVARALAQNPKLLLLDEPTSHLDLGNKGHLVRLLRDLSARGVTIVFTTHEPDVVSGLATDMVLMQKGQILETGTIGQVFTSQSLSRLYQLPVEVIEVAGKRVVLWT